MIYEFHPEAEQEFVEAAAYYERAVTGLGERFGSEVRYAIEQLLEYPELGSPIDADLRRLILTRFPYFLIYSFTADVLRVIAVAHARRRPGGDPELTANNRMETDTTVRLIPSV